VMGRWKEYFEELVKNEKMPKKLRRSLLVPIFKKKGDVQSCGNYRGIEAIQ